jgi:hypothetical protein
MSNEPLDPIELARAEEQLRQERETFEHQKVQSARWFLLRLSVGYTSVVALVSALSLCLYILLRSDIFPDKVVIAAGAGLFGDILGLVATVWKVVFNPGTVAALRPVTLPVRQRGTPAGASPQARPQKS